MERVDKPVEMTAPGTDESPVSRRFTLFTVATAVAGALAYPFWRITEARGSKKPAQPLAETLRKGLQLNKELRYEESAKVFSDAIKQHPDSSGAYLYRGIALSNARRYVDAISDFSKVTQMQPHDGLPYLYRGESYLALGNKDQAAADFRKVMELAANDPRLTVAARFQLQRLSRDTK